MGVAGERPEFDIKPALRGSTPDLSSRLSPEIFHKTAGVKNKSFHSPKWAVKSYQISPAHLPVILPATRSKQIVFAYNQVIIPHCSYHHEGWIPREKPQTATGGLACNSPVPEARTTKMQGGDNP